MSKLISHIQAHRTGRLYEPRIGQVSYSELTSIEDRSFEPFPYLIEYSVRVEIGAKIRIDKSQPEQLDISSKVIARSIQEEVFGEFREYFDRMSRSLWEQDIEKTKETLEEMRARMFSA